MFTALKDHFVDSPTTCVIKFHIVSRGRKLESSLVILTVQTARAIVVCLAGVTGTSQIASAYCANTMEFVPLPLINVETLPMSIRVSFDTHTQYAREKD